jgi:hypothetical protein
MHNEAAFTDGGKAVAGRAKRGSLWRVVAWTAAVLLLASPFVAMLLFKLA